GTSTPPLFSRDSKYMIHAQGSTASVYSSDSITRLITLEGHSDMITDLCWDPEASECVVTSSLDGLIWQKQGI
ncbi:MAG: hypothetical protein EZS28_040451, partial [Streblomastix strix]